MMHRNIEVGIDDTDHIGFFCDCGYQADVTRVRTEKVIVKTGPPREMGQCTWINCRCPKHGDIGWRKFYWAVDTDDYFPFRTTRRARTSS